MSPESGARPSCSVVVRTYNEEKHLGALLDRALAELEQEGGTAEEPDSAAALTQRYR